ncbi:MAG: hypothetical protein HY901_13560 [Deltaproteobacteria bacterium]|nr:hypothetical protein [Deltaproteobacteria bacterium]
MSACIGCEPVLGPEGEIARVLEAQRSGVTCLVPGRGKLELSAVSFAHVLVKPEGEGYTAVGQVDAEGLFAGATGVSYLGLERVPFVRRDGRWEPKECLLPALHEVVWLLSDRRAAAQEGDAERIERLVAKSWRDERFGREQAIAQLQARLAAPAPQSKVERWVVRAERGKIDALEETSGQAPSEADGQRRPRKTRLELVREDGKLRIAAGLL